MKPGTAELWAGQNRHPGDRRRLFGAVADSIDASTVLYPGSYVDIAPSFVFDSVTYLDIDARAPKFFADVDGVREIVAEHEGPPDPDIAFIHADYRNDLDLPVDHFDLLISLYAGFISEHCTHPLRIGGTLLVNPSHGDVAMASLDARYDLTGVIESSAGTYAVRTDALDTYMIPRHDRATSIESLHADGRGIAYTRSPFAYLFTRRH